jgi:hypothetical protein
VSRPFRPAPAAFAFERVVAEPYQGVLFERYRMATA